MHRQASVLHPASVICSQTTVAWRRGLMHCYYLQVLARACVTLNNPGVQPVPALAGRGAASACQGLLAAPPPMSSWRAGPGRASGLFVGTYTLARAESQGVTTVLVTVPALEGRHDLRA